MTVILVVVHRVKALIHSSPLHKNKNLKPDAAVSFFTAPRLSFQLVIISSEAAVHYCAAGTGHNSSQ